MADATALAAALKTPEGMSLRDAVTDHVRAAFGEAVAALRRAAMSRRDALDTASVAAAKPPSDLVAFRAIVEKAKAALDGAWIEEAGRATEAARRLAGALNEATFPASMAADLHALEGDVSAAARAAQSRPADVDRAAREYHKALIADAYERARVEAGSSSGETWRAPRRTTRGSTRCSPRSRPTRSCARFGTSSTAAASASSPSRRRR